MSRWTVLFSSVIPASGTRQIDNTFIKGLLTIQDQELCKSHNQRNLRQQYRKSRFSGDKTMVGHLFQNYDTIYVRFFSHVYLQSFLLHDIRAFFCHVYLRSFLLCGVFIPKYMTIFLQTRIYMRTKKPIYMRYKQACGICGHRKSSYKGHRIIPSVKTPFMYSGAET